ncbi:MAG TPA: glutamate synthase large subunit [Chloroflexota bacterium]|nr:glutamate synthase large subunit [Chloroflexota bacterium]
MKREKIGLYDPAFEHDACGVGFVARIDGQATHGVLELALESVVNVTHRGAIDADAMTGDGAGVLTQLPRALFAKELVAAGVTGVDPNDIAVGVFFFPREAETTQRCLEIVERTCDRHGLRRLAWRQVPVDSSVLGGKALNTQPDIRQLIIGRALGLDDEDYERVLFLARKEIERRISNEAMGNFYVPSMSYSTIVYKGLFVAPQLRAFYKDFADPDYTTALCVFHQRYSTNTLPDWFLAQPFRMLAHNGEINTVQGNRNWMEAREPELASPTWRDEVHWLQPVVWRHGSDSASLDNALETLERSGRDVLHSLMMLTPEAWEHMPDMDAVRRAFYEYHACLIEPWDGPAALAFTDGRIVGATLDRNGLRPARYVITRDGLVVMGSEVGIVELDEAEIVEKGRLGPGEMIAVDTGTKKLLRNAEIKDSIAARRPYGEWIERRLTRLETRLSGGLARNGSANGHTPLATADDLPALWRAFGYTFEDLAKVLEPMGADGKDAVWSMGDDTPLAVLSSKPRPLYNYFRQRFAQVTNPPIDSLREGVVMSLDTYLGRRRNLFEETAEHAALVHVPSPFLLDDEMAALQHRELNAATLDATWSLEEGLDAGLKRLCDGAVQAVDKGHALLVVTDVGTSPGRAPIPALLATGAVHHHLIREGKRMRADLIVQTGEAWDIHHFACLLGYGAGAIHPYLALASVRALVGQRGYEQTTTAELEAHLKKAVDNGLLKIMSKMGISTVASYRGAQIFETVGITERLVDRCFTGTPTKIGGIGLGEIEAEVRRRHGEAYRPAAPLTPRLPNAGLLSYRKDGEHHGYNRLMVIAAQKAAQTGDAADYKAYADLVYAAPPRAIRDVLEWVPAGPAVPLDEVEPAESIVKRFNTSAMSLGALSPEAHRTLAIAMNRLGTRSNTGEGGEDPDWWKPFSDGPLAGEWANSKIKQVASARFGVTPEYLQHAEEIEIKIVQGAKPGEGGQLPAQKVTAFIAKLRHAIPGITLISPPPHHDIYSIEDLAQLIYDLKIANPRARVGVKLVAESGVGTIAAGVAKAYADYILIAGHDGGTGASPMSSIKNAGVPWEIGLAETQQVLLLNDLRGRVRVRTDGGLKTARDVVIASMLGADEFGFGTMAVIAIGCDMARQCHLNTCPTGIATQRPELRAKFTGTPEMVVHYFMHLAQEVRGVLASMGLRSLGELTGRSDLLRHSRKDNPANVSTLNLSAILAQVDPSGRRERRNVQPRNDRHGDTPLDDEIVPAALPALERGERVTLRYPIRNSQRTIGARVSGEIARRWGNPGLPDGSLTLELEGSAGQSLGAFLAPGVRIHLRGQANDYVGKGMHGGEIVVAPPAGATYEPHRNTIMGNTVLYGATGGSLFVCGRAGERFGVRNSGATAVVEGTGDHCCEYMTGGTIVVLGETGRNFAAGMSHGRAFVLDESGAFPSRVNRELVSLERLDDTEWSDELRGLVERHVALTGSARGREILERWSEVAPRFWAVVPHPPQVDTESALARVTSLSGNDSVELQRPVAAARG